MPAARMLVEVTTAEGLSDHELVIYDLPASYLLCVEGEAKRYWGFRWTSDIDILNFLEESSNRFSAFCEMISVSVDMLWLFLKHVVLERIDKFVPIHTVKRKKQNPWVMREILQSKRRINRIERFQPCSRGSLSVLRRKLHALVRSSRFYFFNVRMHNFLKANPR